MTSLALQLQQLALPGVTFEGELRKRPSLLFDSQKAATLDRDALYGLGVNGFDGICSSDPSLRDEFATLFDESAKNVERSVMSKNENDTLDTMIQRFLLRVAPFLLSRSAQKCLEWLIYRMKIHNFNAADMLTSFLPFHNTKIFVRMLQLFDASFLKKEWSGLSIDTVPSRNEVAGKCLKDRGFFARICNSVVKSIDAHASVVTTSGALRPAVNLYAVYALETTFNLKRGENEFLSTLMPFIVRGLESTVADFKAATYMVICMISSKIPLTEPVIVCLLQALSKNYFKNPQLECLMTIITLTQSQENATNFPKQCAEDLCEAPDILGHLRSLEDFCNIEGFLLLFMKRLVLTAAADTHDDLFTVTANEDTLLSLVRGFPLSKTSQQSMVRALIEEAHKNIKSSSLILKAIFAMHKKYPESLTHTISALGKLEKYGDKVKELMTALLEVAEVEDAFLPLVLNFDAPEPSLRTSAVTVLEQMLSANANLVKSDFVRQAIKERLTGEVAADVVTAVMNVILSYPESFFYNKESACRTLVGVLLRARGKIEWAEVSGTALKLLMSTHFSSCSNEVASLISLIICDSLVHEVCMSEKAIDLQALQHDFFSRRKTWILSLNWKDVKATINSVVKVVTENPKIVNDLKKASDMITDVLREISPKSSTRQRVPFHFLLNYVICKMFLGGDEVHRSSLIMVKNVFLEVSRELKSLIAVCCQDMIRNQTKNSALGVDETASDFDSAFSVMVTAFARNDDENWTTNSTLKVLLATLTECMKMVKKGGECVPQESAYSQWDIPSSVDAEIDDLFLYRFVKREILELLLQSMPFLRFGLDSAVCECLKKAMRLFLREYFASTEDVVQFLAPYWSSTRFPAEVKAQALYFAISVIEKNHGFDASKLLQADCPHIPSLLIALSDNSQVVRKAATSLISKITLPERKEPFSELVIHLSQHREVIVVDAGSLSEILTTFFAPKKGKKSTSKNGTLEFLLKHHIVSETAPIETRVRLLQTLQKLDAKLICESLAPVLDIYLDVCASEKPLTCEEALFVSNGLMKIDAKCITTGSVKTVFWKAMKCDKKMRRDMNEAVSPQSAVLKVVTKDFFANLDEETQKKLIHCLLAIATDNTAAVNGVAKVFKLISLDMNLIAQELETLLHGKTSCQPAPAKRKKIEETILNSSTEWQKIVLLMEFLQQKKKITNTDALLAPLFQLLGATLDSQNDAEIFDRMDYLEQLILTLLLRIVQKLKSSLEGDKALGEALKTACKVQTIVHCVRSAKNTQTQHHALLLLAELTDLFPEKVLDNVMAIFTFMGSHLLRQDDSYSFQVVSKTMKVVIPAVIKANHKTSAANTALRIIHAFIDSLPDIPSHRKVVILHELLDTLGGAEHLWIFILLLGNLSVRKPSVEENCNTSIDVDSKPQSRMSLQEITDVCLSVCEREPRGSVLRNVLKCSDYLMALPFDDVKRGVRRSPVIPSVVEEKTLSTLQIRKLHIVVVTFFANILEKNQQNLIRILRASQEDENVGILLQELYEKCLEQICKAMSYAQSATGSDTAKFSKAITAKLYTVMQLVNVVLPFNESLGIFEKLLEKDGVFTKRKSLELLAERLACNSESLGENEVISVARISESLAKLVLTSVKQSIDTEQQDTDLLCYTALITLKVAVRNCGQLKPDGFVGALGALCKVVSTSELQDTQVLAAAFLCLAEMCTCLKAYCISHLNNFVPVLLQTMCEKRTLENDSLLFSCVTALHRLLESLPDFTSAYLKTAVEKITTLMLLARFSTESDDESILARIGTRLKVIVNIIATEVPSRVLLSVLSEAQKTDTERTLPRIKPLCTIVLKHIESLNRDKVLHSHAALSPLIHALLDFRATNSSDHDAAALVEDVEDLTTDIALATMLKLPENSFRIFFFGLADWATTKFIRDRSVVYYKLMLKLSKRMKGLFSLFAGAVIESAAGVLHDADSMDHFELLKLVCATLHSIFLHDTSRILTKDRFELLQPFIDLIEVALSSPSGEALVQDIVVPLLGQIAFSVGDDSCQKLLNYKILIKSRHPSATVRRMSLAAVENVARRLGEDYSVLLPESIPFLSELMEDDEEEVEKQCHAVIRNLEKIVGEPLQKYFTE